MHQHSADKCKNVCLHSCRRPRELLCNLIHQNLKAQGELSALEALLQLHGMCTQDHQIWRITSVHHIYLRVSYIPKLDQNAISARSASLAQHARKSSTVLQPAVQDILHVPWCSKTCIVFSSPHTHGLQVSSDRHGTAVKRQSKRYIHM